MKAAVYRPGVVRIQDVQTPVPKDNEVLVRIQATTICAADYRLQTVPHFQGWIMGLWRSSRTTILGMELSGTVEALGPGA
jgi:NADPH:quinone reductase-like Zn-dependent oxidoreductase